MPWAWKTTGMEGDVREFKDMPNRIDRLPRDHRGFPVPYFVEWIDGKPDFRYMDPDKFKKCTSHNHCWVCGEKMGRFKTFTAGPMCGINRTSAEPPAHYECALFSARNCPFLMMPKMRRNDKGLEEAESAGFMIKRNPGVAMLWTTKSYSLFSDGKGGRLVEMGDPERVEWFCEGRAATREEALRSIETGLPLLEKVAKQYGEMDALEAAKQAFMRYLPEAA